MTITELSAGDFIKNLLDNLPKEGNNSPPKKEKSQFIPILMVPTPKIISNTICIKLKELKNLIKGTTDKDILPGETINDYLMYPSVINISSLLQKLFTILEVESINQIFMNLVEALNLIYKKNFQDELTKSSNELNTKKNILFDIIQELNFFISPSLIYASDPLISKISFDIFMMHMLKENKIGKNILESFINIFNIKHLIFDYFLWNKDQIIKNLNSVQKLLSLISILNLEKNYTFEFILLNKKDQFFQQEIILYDLYLTYSKSIKMVIDLTEYLISIKRNWISITVIEKIIYDKIISERLDNYVKKLMIINLMDINFKSFTAVFLEKDELKLSNIDKKLYSKLISYYHILSDNKNIINYDFNMETKILNCILSELLKMKDYEKCIKMLSYLDLKFLSHIKKDTIHQLIKDLSFDKVERMKNVLKYFPDEVNYLLKDYEKKNNLKDGIKLIKILNLDWKDYDKIWDRYSIRLFYNYKIKECLEDKFEILLDYALVSETLYNELITKLLGKIKRANKKDTLVKDKENVNSNIINSIKEIEFELNENNIDNNAIISNKSKKSEFNFKVDDELENDNFLSEFSAEDIIQDMDSEDDNECRIILNNIHNVSTEKLREKVAILFKQGRDKNYLLTKANKHLFDSVFKFNLPKVNINKYIEDDKFAPHDSSCYQISKKVHVIFIDSILKFTEYYLQHFQHSKIIGVDSEWKQQFYARNKEFCSIIQMANYEEKNVMILDLLKLVKEKEFIELFDKYFNGKTFVGYSFDASDLNHFSTGMQNSFKLSSIIDLVDLYQYKFLSKAKGLKNLCKEILGINLCKYEQCSFWENRPLRQSQLHYAAVDALVCVSLFKKLMHN